MSPSEPPTRECGVFNLFNMHQSFNINNDINKDNIIVKPGYVVHEGFKISVQYDNLVIGDKYEVMFLETGDKSKLETITDKYPDVKDNYPIRMMNKDEVVELLSIIFD